MATNVSKVIAVHEVCILWFGIISIAMNDIDLQSHVYLNYTQFNVLLLLRFKWFMI